MIKGFKEWLEDDQVPVLDAVVVVEQNGACLLIEQRKTYDGRFERNLLVDNPTHGVGERHAHLLGRRGDEYGIVTVSGKGSHEYKGQRFKIHADDADALRDLGFDIPSDGIIEWVVLSDQPTLLLD